MKIKNLLLIIVMILSATQLSFAAFPVKHTAITNSSATNVRATMPASAGNYKLHKQSWFTMHITNPLRVCADMFSPERKRSNTNGILSLIFGIATFVIFPLFCIPAIILGSIGKKHNEQCAQAGFTLGVVGVVLLAVVVVLILLLGGFAGVF